MPVFRRAQWPKDHRDEVVAGALVGAVVIVLGYASGIGATSASGEAAAPVAPPPAATAPPSPTPGPTDGAGPQSPIDSVPQAPGIQVPVGQGELPGSGAEAGHSGGHGQEGSGGHAGGGSGQGTSPTPSPSPTSTPSPSPSGTDTPCADGEVRLVQPLLTGLTQPVLGLLGSTDSAADSAAEDQDAQPSAPSPCVGLTSDIGLLGGIVSLSPSPSTEAKP